MNFLKDIHSKKRLFLQLEAYQNTFHLNIINALVDKSIFKLEHIDINQLDLSVLEVSKNLRLGNRLELFFEFLVNQSKNTNIIKKNIQVVEDKITIGELDFIIENTTGLKHIEIATKFYLYDENLKEWIGPNRNDSLYAKAKKLKSKQFPLLNHHKTRAIFKESNIDIDKIEQNIHFKSLLFVPHTFDKNLFEKEIRRNIKGIYLYKTEFKNLEKKDYEYFIPEKQDWLVEPENGEVWFPFKNVLQSIELHFLDNKNPLVWIKKSDYEYERVFVVDWNN